MVKPTNYNLRTCISNFVSVCLGNYPESMKEEGFTCRVLIAPKVSKMIQIIYQVVLFGLTSDTVVVKLTRTYKSEGGLFAF